MRRLVVIFLIFACSAVAGCADNNNDRNSDNRFGGFYGGINGGGGVSRQ